MKNITYKRETIAYDFKINYAKKSIGQKFMDYLGPKAFNSLNINVKKYLRTNSTKNENIYILLKHYYLRNEIFVFIFYMYIRVFSFFSILVHFILLLFYLIYFIDHVSVFFCSFCQHVLCIYNVFN